MKLTVIMGVDEFQDMTEEEQGFTTEGVYIDKRRSLRELDEGGYVEKDEVALQITVEKVYKPLTTVKLKEMKI